MDNNNIKQNDIIEVAIIDYGANGEGIAKHNGKVIFVPYAIKGEKVKVKINHIKRNYAYATLQEVIQSSAKRVQPDCNRFYKCGGCDLSHMAYSEQLQLKKQALTNTLKKNTGKDYDLTDIVPSPKQHAYRNKVQLPFGIVNNKVAVGFYRQGSHKIVSITKCFLHDSWLQKLIEIILEFANKYNLSVYDEAKQVGLLRHIVARYMDKQLCIALVINGDKLPQIDYLINQLNNSFESFSLYLSVNKMKTNVIMGKELIKVIDNDFKINILGIDVVVNPLSFLQINNEVRDLIYLDVLQKTNRSDIVIDAYSGIGILGAILAQNGAKKVYNIEIIPEAIADANNLAKNNDLSNIINICGDAAIELPKLINTSLDTQSNDKDSPNNKISIILDPPRKGVNFAVIKALKNINHPIDLIYISCNPATLSRDLALLTEEGNYAIKSITPYDMFPQTKHLETLVCLRAMKSKASLN